MFSRPANRQLALVAAAFLASGACFAQFSGYWIGTGSSYVRLEGGLVVDESRVRTARETAGHSVTLPEWTNPVGFEADVFTFARVMFPSDPRRYGGDGWGGGRDGGRLGWWVDYPDADLNISYRLNQLTSLRVDPDARVIRLTDPDLPKYPFLYMVHIERMSLEDADVSALRRYLMNGGFLLVGDFWGTAAIQNLKSEMRRVLPDRQWVELTIDHPVFRSVYKFKGPMQLLQVPTYQFWNTDYDPTDPRSITTSRYRGEGSEEMRAWALYDDQHRLMCLALHNSDLSDGWEREGEDPTYFRAFSETRSYPLLINILTYVMTH